MFRKIENLKYELSKSEKCNNLIGRMSKLKHARFANVSYARALQTWFWEWFEKLFQIIQGGNEIGCKGNLFGPIRFYWLIHWRIMAHRSRIFGESLIYDPGLVASATFYCTTFNIQRGRSGKSFWSQRKMRRYFLKNYFLKFFQILRSQTPES